MEYTDLSGEITPLVGGVADPSIIRNVRNVAIDFAKRTKILTHTKNLAANGYNLVVEPAQADERVFIIDWVKYCGNEIYFEWEENLLTLPSTLPADSSVEVRFITIPTRSSRQCDDRVMDTWYEAIVAGALAKLYAMKTAPWFDPAMAQSHAATYAQLVIDATGNKRGDDRQKVHYMAYGGL